MSGVDFLDTNILVYAVDQSDSRKQAVASALLSEGLRHKSGVVSYQVVQEALHVITGKFKTRVRAEDVPKLLDDIWLPLMKVLPTAGLYREALRIKDRYGFSFYDALVIAAALHAGCKRLLSEDLQHGQQIEGLKIVNPFLE